MFDELNRKNNFTSRRNFSTNRAIFAIKHILLQALVQFILLKPQIHNTIPSYRPLSIPFYCPTFRIAIDHCRYYMCNRKLSESRIRYNRLWLRPENTKGEAVTRNAKKPTSGHFVVYFWLY